MIPSIEQIELAIMNYHEFNFRQNLILFRVTNFSGVVNHECDCLIMTKSGYLTEIEIKRSYADFLNDFKKNHVHDDDRIKYFYFMIHESIKDKVLKKLVEVKRVPTGILVYDDDCRITYGFSKSEIEKAFGGCLYLKIEDGELASYSKGFYARKLLLEEQFQLARLGAMRYKNMTEKLIKSGNGKPI